MKYGRMSENIKMEDTVPILNHKRHRYPHSIVWAPIPLLTWLFPFIGHMGIATSTGIITDFAGPYTVTEDQMAFGWPTRYWVLDMDSVGADVWDQSLQLAAVEYRKRMHNLCCDNCHSHVAYALNNMNYNGRRDWNMVNLAIYTFFRARYVGIGGFMKTWLPFTILLTIVLIIVMSTSFSSKT